MPEVEPVGPVAGEEEVEQAVAVEVEPGRAPGVHPGGQAGRVGHSREFLAAVVVKQFGLAPFVQEKIRESVVVVVAPDDPHRDARAGLVQVGHAHRRGDVDELPVVVVAIEAVVRPLAAVGDVEVGPAVAVEVGHGDRGPHRGDLRHDVGELRVQLRRLVREIDARSNARPLPVGTRTATHSASGLVGGTSPRLVRSAAVISGSSTIVAAISPTNNTIANNPAQRPTHELISDPPRGPAARRENARA